MALPEPLTAAMRLLASGAWQDAETAAHAAMANAADDPAALLLAGLAIAAMGEDARAAPILMQVAAVKPNGDHPCTDLARLKPTLPRVLVARQFRACLRLASDDDRLRLAFADFLLDTNQAAEAEQLLVDGPYTAAARHMVGMARAEQALFRDAVNSFQCAVKLNPDAAASWSNLGMVLKVVGRFDQAIAAHDRAVTLEPGNPRFRVNRADALLKAGRWESAWRDYEARFDLTDSPPFDLLRLMPSLSHDESLDGLTVLALHEDGFGDTLQFLRYIPLLAERGARVVACVPRSLARVMRGVPGVADVVTDSRHLPAHDFICPMFSLPRVFGTTVDTIPPVPAVAMDPALLRHWAGRLPHGGLRVGLVWAGQARPSLPGFATLDWRRSAGLEAFQPLLEVPGVSFVSLQAGQAARQPRPSGLEIFDPMPEITDFADTAAVIAALDVVVSVDTSVVHLAGLMGKPVFLLDRYDGDWRWLSGRLDTPWYPGSTIFRQDQPHDWSGAMTAAAASLRALAVRHGANAASRGLRRHASVA